MQQKKQLLTESYLVKVWTDSQNFRALNIDSGKKWIRLLLYFGKVGHKKPHKKNKFMLSIILFDFLSAMVIVYKAI